MACYMSGVKRAADRINQKKFRVFVLLLLRMMMVHKNTIVSIILQFTLITRSVTYQGTCQTPERFSRHPSCTKYDIFKTF